jgi:hypothetical protein
MGGAMTRRDRRTLRRFIRQQRRLTREIHSLGRWIERDHRRFLRMTARLPL